MTEPDFPWIELAIAAPLVGAGIVSRCRDPFRSQRTSLVVSTITLVLVLLACVDYFWFGASGGRLEILALDPFSAPLLPLVAMVFLLTTLATLRTKARRFSFAGCLVSEAIMLATFSCHASWLLIGLLAIGVLPPLFELRARGKPTGVFLGHMVPFVALLIVGWGLVQSGGADQATWGVAFLVAAIALRAGLAPLHCWMTDLFEHASFGTALLFVAPLPGAYAVVRLLLPLGSHEVLHDLGFAALLTAFYAAGMALVQREARRFYCYLFISHSSLVMVGLVTAMPIGVAGALCVWLSTGLALTGFALTLRALESRFGRLSLVNFHGLYEHAPALAVCFLLTGLASVGFPGTFGFIGGEMLVDGAVIAYPWVGVAVVIVAALNGIAVVQQYFKLFTGTRYFSNIWLGITFRERIAVLTLAALIFAGGLFPQHFIASRYEAASQLLDGLAENQPHDEATIAEKSHDQAIIVER